MFWPLLILRYAIHILVVQEEVILWCFWRLKGNLFHDFWIYLGLVQRHLRYHCGIATYWRLVLTEIVLEWGWLRREGGCSLSVSVRLYHLGKKYHLLIALENISVIILIFYSPAGNELDWFGFIISIFWKTLSAA